MSRRCVPVIYLYSSPPHLYPIPVQHTSFVEHASIVLLHAVSATLTLLAVRRTLSRYITPRLRRYIRVLLYTDRSLASGDLDADRAMPAQVWLNDVVWRGLLSRPTMSSKAVCLSRELACCTRLAWQLVRFKDSSNPYSPPLCTGLEMRIRALG